MLTIAELFPPLCQRVKIRLNILSCPVNLVKYLSLHSIANDQEHGFLPTFGPTFVHFYSRDKVGEMYVGKVLMSLHTQLQHDYMSDQKRSSKKSLLTLNEVGLHSGFWDLNWTKMTWFQKNLWKYERVLLFGVVLNVTALDRKFSRRRVSFELCIGSNLTRNGNMCESTQNRLQNVTMDTTPTNQGNVWYLDYGDHLPCMSVEHSFPDLRKRFYNANMIKKISTELVIWHNQNTIELQLMLFKNTKNLTTWIKLLQFQKKRLDEIEPLFELERWKVSSDLIEVKLTEALDTLADSCRKYIDMAKSGLNTYVTDLDREKYKLCMREMVMWRAMLSNMSS